MTNIEAYRAAMRDEAVPAGYRALLGFMRNLKTEISAHDPALEPGAIHVGAMDVTFIPLLPSELRSRKLKVLVMFFHSSFRFELWLSGINKTAQIMWWEKFGEQEFAAYELVDDPLAEHHFVREPVVDDAGFEDPEELTRQLVEASARFVANIEEFLRKTS